MPEDETVTVAPLALTMGEPAGIGGEIALKAWKRHRGEIPPFFLIDDPGRIEALAAATGIETPVHPVDDPAAASDVFPDALPVLPLGQPVAATPGKPSTATAGAVLASIERAVALARTGGAAGVVTNPIMKSVLYEGGFAFPGHTEYLAHLTGTKTAPVMMLASPHLRVVPVTIHVSLRTALDTLDSAMIEHALRVTHAALRTDFAVETPWIAVAGLNPHAGEEGSMGNEESEIIAPAIEAARADGIFAAGPIAPDSLFTRHMRKSYDAAVCMYHDQALIPIKTLDFDKAVNVTLGLPIVRTSPDHGTALEIAGKGQASETSLVEALRLAGEIAANRRAAATSGNGTGPT